MFVALSTLPQVNLAGQAPLVKLAQQVLRVRSSCQVQGIQLSLTYLLSINVAFAAVTPEQVAHRLLDRSLLCSLRLAGSVNPHCQVWIHTYPSKPLTKTQSSCSLELHNAMCVW